MVKCKLGEKFKRNKTFTITTDASVYSYNKCSFWLSHYPMKMGNYKDKHPTWNLSGHTHSTESIDGDDSIYNVAMDAHNCFPISIEQIMAEIKVYRDEHPVQPFNKIK